MNTFTKQVSGIYDLVYDYSSSLLDGEVIRSIKVYLDDVWISGEIPSGTVINSYSIYDKETAIVRVQNGENTSGYLIRTAATTNRNNVYSESINLTIDETYYPFSYQDFDYQYLLSGSGESLYILPNLNNSDFGYNREYAITINPGLSGVVNDRMSTTTSFWFTTQYCPLFATVTTIKLMGGPEIEGFSDDTIYRMIHKNSIDAVDLLNSGSSTKYPYTAFGCTPENVPYQLRKYVECKTTYDLLNIADSITNKGLSQSKHLGDMDIKYGGSPATGVADPNVKKDLYDCFHGLMNLLMTGAEGLKTAVRGLYDVTKGFPHPVLDATHNRIIRDVDIARSDPTGPWRPATGWRYSATYNPQYPYVRRSF